MPTESDDPRTGAQVLRQYERVETIKARLVRAGALSGDATPKDVLDTLKRQIPADLFGSPPKK